MLMVLIGIWLSLIECITNMITEYTRVHSTMPDSPYCLALTAVSLSKNMSKIIV